MADGPTEREEGPPEEEMGTPVSELAELLDDARPGFARRVTESIRRRAFASHLATFSWTAMWTAVLEFVQMVFSLLAPDGPNRGEND